MKCPNCYTENEPSSKFCGKCGYALQGMPPKPRTISEESRHLLKDGRFLLAAFGLWVLEKILESLSFLSSIYWIISLLIALFIGILLVMFSISLSRIWPGVFPKYWQAGAVLSGLVYIIVILVLNGPLEALISHIIDDFMWSPALNILHASFVTIALILIFWMTMILISALPGWLTVFRPTMSPRRKDIYLSGNKN